MKSILEKAANIKLLLCDLDGVLTDGYLYLTDNDIEHKAFHVHDGFGLKLLMLSGVEVGIITTSKTPIVSKRMDSLGIKHVYQGQINKQAAFDDVTTKLSLSDHEVAYIGDDLPDLPFIQRAGLGVAVGNAHHMVKAGAALVTEKPGGHGAVRELCDLIMQSQHSLDRALAAYQDLHVS